MLAYISQKNNANYKKLGENGFLLFLTILDDFGQIIEREQMTQPWIY